MTATPAWPPASLPRLFVEQPLTAGGAVELEGSAANYLGNVMRLKEGDPLPFDIDRIAPSTFVGEVVMKSEYTPLLKAAKDKGCAIQVGTDMLFEQIPAYLEFFGFGTSTADELRAVAQIQY